jgi:hypothetical protein
MKNFSLVLISLSVLFAGCFKSKEDLEKQGVLSHQELTALIIDIYLAEGVADNLPLVKDSAMNFFRPYEQKLLKQKNIPDSVLMKTYDYYLSHPKEFEAVFEVVIDSLTLREQRTSPTK